MRLCTVVRGTYTERIGLVNAQNSQRHYQVLTYRASIAEQPKARRLQEIRQACLNGIEILGAKQCGWEYSLVEGSNGGNDVGSI